VPLTWSRSSAETYVPRSGKLPLRLSAADLIEVLEKIGGLYPSAAWVAEKFFALSLGLFSKQPDGWPAQILPPLEFPELYYLIILKKWQKSASLIR
jgi:hypothetical protein